MLKIQNSFRLGLFGGLGVIVALGIGAAVGSLATILTYVGAALFLALGLDPIVSFLEKRTWPRWLAILAVLIGVLGVLTGLVFAIIPLISGQISNLVKQIQTLVPSIIDGSLPKDVQHALPWLDVSAISQQLTDWVATLDYTKIGGGVLQAGITIANGVFGAIIVVILTLYFVASLSSTKRGLYQLVPASKRETFVDIAEQISKAVGRYVMGQGALGLANGILSFVFLTFVFRVQYSALLAFIALIGSLIPLVGTLTSSVVITLSVLLFEGGRSMFTGDNAFLNGGGPVVVWVLVYYAIYMQVEAYIVSPRIMKQAVAVPGVVVVIAALAGGTLLGVLGALVAIPVAASILLIVKQVVIPRQNAL